jgi:iron complex transport system substrate-binding protein/vitamin B12 transport system substrate-binding protein
MAHVRASALAAILAALAVCPAAPASGVPPPAAPAAPVSRAVTLAPHITEIIFAAGAGERIAATVSSSDYPPAARRIPRIGDGMNINVEKIIALRPDLIAAWMPSGAARTLEPVLEKLGIPLIYSEPHRLDDIAREVVRFGKLFGTEPIARRAAAGLRQRLENLRRQYMHRRPVSVFIEVGTAPLYTIGGDPLVNDALRTCGGVNIYAKSTLAAPQVSVESVLVNQPDVMITAAAKGESVEPRLEAWSTLRLKAALENHLYAVDPDELFRPGPRLIEATEKLCEVLDRAR